VEGGLSLALGVGVGAEAMMVSIRDWILFSRQLLKAAEYTKPGFLSVRGEKRSDRAYFAGSVGELGERTTRECSETEISGTYLKVFLTP